MEGRSDFLMYSISTSESSVHTIGKFELIGKLMLYVLSQG